MRPFAELVDGLVADARRAPDVGALELEATGFAMAFAYAGETAGDPGEVVARLAGLGDPHADAALRAIATYGGGALAEAAARVPVDAARAPAVHVGAYAVEAVWRSASADLRVDVADLARPDGSRQSFTLVTGPDAWGAPLLGGGMAILAPEDDGHARVAGLATSLGLGPPEAAPPGALLDRLRRGAATNAAILVEVSASLAIAARFAAHALGGSAGAAPPLPWAEDEAETDDDRAEYVRRVLLRAAEEGADPGDPEALAAWFAGFQERRPGEQLRRLGLPGVASGDEPPRAPRADAARRSKRKAARRARKRNR